MRLRYDNKVNSWILDLKAVETETTQLTQTEKTARDQLLEKYGWMSPKEFYSLSDDQKAAAQGKVKGIVLDLDASELDLGDDSTDPKDYVWVNSLSNWCYWKVEQDYGNLSVRTGLGELCHELAEARDWLRDKVSSACVDLWNFVTDIDWTNPLSVLSLPYRILAAEYMAVWGTMYFLTVGPYYVTYAVGVAIKQAVTYGYPIFEDIPETGINDEPRPDPNQQYPESCMITYVWDGYHKRWVSLKRLVNYWRTIMYSNYPSFIKTCVELAFPDPNTEVLKNSPIEGQPCKWEDKVKSILVGWGVKNDEMGGNDNPQYNIMDMVVACFDSYKKGQQDWDTCLGNVGYALRFSKGMMEDTRYLMRQKFILDTGIDPIEFGDIYTQGICEKHARWMGNNFHDSTWAQFTMHEMWGLYVPLHADDCRIKYLDDQTGQTLIRAHGYQKQLYRDRHTVDVIWDGTPAFTRFSDGRMWMALWIRWSGIGWDATVKHWDKHSVNMTQQWTTSDAQLHTQIVSQMFDKHDDYGYDEWCINSNYGLEFKYFTVSEETPTEFKSKGESHLINTKTDIMTTELDETDCGEIKFTIQTPTIERNKNDLLTTVEKWK